MQLRTTLSQIWGNIQYLLFPVLEDEYGPLTEKHKKLIAILELVRIESFLFSHSWIGRPPKNRVWIARAFVAKCVFNFTYTNQLIDKLQNDKILKRICGWDTQKLPSEATFSRAFAEFSESFLAERVHEALVIDMYQNEIVGHVCKDSTPIMTRESVGIKKEKSRTRKSRAHKDKKTFQKLTRLEKQASGNWSFEQMMEDLPQSCDRGSKKGLSWKGYKLHLAVDDHCIPLAAIITSASVHDSQVAIPLAIKTKQRVDNFYDLMDAAYSIKEILDHSRSLGHVPHVDSCPRTEMQKKEKEEEKNRRKILNWKPVEEKRYAERMKTERANALFKETCGGRILRYKGIKKVSSQVMFNLLTITAVLLLNMAR